MRKNPASQLGLCSPRVLLALAFCSVGAFLAMRSFAATPPSGLTGSVAKPHTAASSPQSTLPVTDRVSVAPDGTDAAGRSFFPSISDDGRFVAFHSDALNLVFGDTNGTVAFFSNANNLVPGDTNGYSDVFVHDRQTGATERVSVASDGTQANHVSTYPSISADGRYVVFNSFASNLVPGDTNRRPDVFVHDRQTGVTERVSVASDGTEAFWLAIPVRTAS